MRTTVAAALKEFDLIAGVGSQTEKQACAMSLLAWLDECDEWTDHPRCAHPVVASWVIQANDADGTTKTQRAKLVRLGLKGVLDTWWIPGVVLAEALRLEVKAEPPKVYERTVKALDYLIGWKKNRPIPDLSRADLSGANLSGADLSGANLSGADLSRANLPRANLPRANLSRANLSWANLSRANLSRANLSGANLFGADLYGANLSRASGTPVSGTPAGWKIIKDLYVKDSK